MMPADTLARAFSLVAYILLSPRSSSPSCQSLNLHLNPSGNPSGAPVHQLDNDGWRRTPAKPAKATTLNLAMGSARFSLVAYDIWVIMSHCNSNKLTSLAASKVHAMPIFCQDEDLP